MKVLEEKIQPIHRSRFRPCPLQPRTEFPEQALNEFGLNLRTENQINPIVARMVGPHPDYPGTDLEILAGERRWRAGEARPHPITGELMAEIEVYPTLIRNYSDKEAIEIMLSENIQRADLQPLDESRGFAIALEHGHSVESIAAAIGKDPQYVGDRRSLWKLSEHGVKALRDGVIDFKTARIICSCPPKVAELLEERVLNPKKYDGFRLKPGALDADETLTLKLEEFVRDLRGCVFDTKDPNLLTLATNDQGERLEGGACTDCHWMLGNTPDRIEVKGKGGGPVNLRCLNPACFKRKVEIHQAAELLRRQTAGAKPMKADDARLAASKDSPFVRVDSKLSPDEVAPGVSKEKPPTWGEIALNGPAEPERFVTTTDAGEVVEYIRRQDAVTAAEKNGTSKYLSLASGRGRSVQEDALEAQRKEANDKAKQRGVVARAVMAALVAAIEDQGVSPETLAALRAVAIRHASTPGCVYVAKRRKIDAKPDVFAAIEKATADLKGSKLWAFVLELLFANDFAFIEDPKATHVVPDNVKPLLKHYGVDVKKIERGIAADNKARAGEKKPEAKAKAKKTGDGKAETEKKGDGSLGDHDRIAREAANQPLRDHVAAKARELGEKLAETPPPAADDVRKAIDENAAAAGSPPPAPAVVDDRCEFCLTVHPAEVMCRCGKCAESVPSEKMRCVIRDGFRLAWCSTCYIQEFSCEVGAPPAGEAAEISPPAAAPELPKLSEVLEKVTGSAVVDTGEPAGKFDHAIRNVKDLAAIEAAAETPLDTSPPPKVKQASTVEVNCEKLLKEIKPGDKCSVATIQRKLKLGYQAALAVFASLVFAGRVEDGKLTEEGGAK